jgi:hypothetical protein
VTGKLFPVTENPVPEVEPALTVTGAVPFEVNVTDCVTAVPTATLPKASDVALALNAGTAALSCIAKLFEVELAIADKVAVCDAVTEETVAVKVAEDAPDGTVMLAGTATALLLLASVTPVADGAAELNVTVHVVNPDPINELLPHESALKDGVN